jgi:phenylpyruvate tautomerase PptA (4-oxalocrotonate tautomerase family)
VRAAGASIVCVPVVDVEIVGNVEAKPELGQRLADALGDALESQPGRTWVRLRHLPRDSYAESGGPLDDAIRPVFVTIMEQRRPQGDVLLRRIDKVTSVIADVIEPDGENVHVFYAEDGAGRVAFGGSLVE